MRAAAAAAYDRCFCPEGQARQLLAIQQSGSRGDLLPNVRVPTLVIHGSRDTLVDPSGGRRTAELVPGARYVEIEGMGHDHPRVLWDRWVDEWARARARLLSAAPARVSRAGVARSRCRTRRRRARERGGAAWSGSGGA